MTEEEQARAILKRVRAIEIRTRRFVTDAMAGAYHSAFKGQGIDFEEVREYEPGDDVRSIDWNVTARTSRPHVKKFREERQLTIMLLVDLSASGVFGSKHISKRELAAELASVLAFSASRNNDKVGLLLFTDQVEKIIHPRKGRRHILRVIREVLFFRPRHRRTDMLKPLDALNRIMHRRSIAFLISDFLDGSTGLPLQGDSTSGSAFFSLIGLTGKRHDLTAISLSDPREQHLPDVGRIALEDAETGQVVELDTSNKSLRAAFELEHRRSRTAMRRSFHKCGTGMIELSTDQPYEIELRRYFESRRFGRRVH